MADIHEAHPREMNLTSLVLDLRLAVVGYHLLKTMDQAYPLTKGGRLLDVCCGSGKAGVAYAIRGAEVILLDNSESALRYSLRLAEGAQVLLGKPLRMEALLASIFQIPEPDNSFDFVFSDGAHEHWGLEKRREAIKETLRVLKPGGRLFIAVPNIKDPEQKKVSEEAVYKWEGMEEKEQLISEADLSEDLAALGLINIHIGAEGKVAFAWGEKKSD